MRVVQILPELIEGGVERGVVELNREFTKRGVDSWVISAGGKLVDQIESDGGSHRKLNVCSKNPLTAISRSWKLSKALDELNPDIIHARSRVPAWLCRIANRRRGRPFVTTVHGLNRINRYSRVMVTGDRVITVSEVVRDYVCKGYRLAPADITVIQRGVDMDVFHPERVERDFIEDFQERFGLVGKTVIASVGRVTQLKDYESFIKAIARLSDSFPDLVGLIVGGVHPDKQSYFKTLEQLASDMGVEDRIVFTGSQVRMPEIYSLSRVVVNASLKMGNVGRTVVEALAMNRPVIATTYPDLENLVENKRNGCIIETQDDEGLAQAIIEVLEAEHAGIRETVPREFTLESMVHQVLQVYESLM